MEGVIRVILLLSIRIMLMMIRLLLILKIIIKKKSTKKAVLIQMDTMRKVARQVMSRQHLVTDTSSAVTDCQPGGGAKKWI